MRSIIVSGLNSWLKVTGYRSQVPKTVPDTCHLGLETCNYFLFLLANSFRIIVSSRLLCPATEVFSAALRNK